MSDEDSSGKDIKTMAQDVLDAIQRIQRGQKFSNSLKADCMETPLGPILLAGDDASLYLAGFLEKSSLVRKATLVQKSSAAWLTPGESHATRQAKQELDAYFHGTLRSFQTPLSPSGTAFQKRVWSELQRIPFGQTLSHDALAEKIGRPAAFRAVAQASTQNPISLIIPCHRIINANGDLGGYDGGIERKRWLLEFEKSIL